MADENTYQVLINDEEQYSLWPSDKEIPAGWHATGPRGSRQECMDHVDEVWTDMRPRSLRERMASQ
ncbi:MbtH family protein [Amycolatopsis sp. cmx-11-12]|uniref:MbtH family protein n=1 Tax=Amycolatopsis sp. cmx-11-12 TaxID=2785795 RepID=UPI0039174381